MVHNPIQISSLSLSFHTHDCFNDFSIQIPAGSHIGVMGRNGTGKSSLLKIIAGIMDATDGYVKMPNGIKIAYVPQVVEGKNFTGLSGGQRFNKALGEALGMRPNILLLDEPTNHLDYDNRQSLMQMLQNFKGTYIVVSHDPEFLRTCVTSIWHIKDEEVRVFSGNYDHYLCEQGIQESTIKKIARNLNAQKREMDRRICRVKVKHDAREVKKRAIDMELSDINFDKTITPSFSLKVEDIGDGVLLMVADGAVGYSNNKKTVVRNINFTLRTQSRIAINGSNGSGKSTIFKALLGDSIIRKTGEWNIAGDNDVDQKEIIGYLDQYYSSLNPQDSVYESISKIRPDWIYSQIRGHLSGFLFRGDSSIENFVMNLSGGEKARLSLAQIAAKTPRILLLDEITNNIDLDTRNYVIDVLKRYPGAMIIISHDRDFLDRIGITKNYIIRDRYFCDL